MTNSTYGAWRWPIREDSGAPDSLRIGPPQKLNDFGYPGQIAVSADGQVIVLAMSNTGVEAIPAVCGL